MCPFQKMNSGGKLEGKSGGVFLLTESTPKSSLRSQPIPEELMDFLRFSTKTYFMEQPSTILVQGLSFTFTVYF